MATIPTPEAGLVIAYAYLLALAIVSASARKHRDFLLGLSDNGRALLLTLIGTVLAIIRKCSQSAEAAHIARQRQNVVERRPAARFRSEVTSHRDIVLGLTIGKRDPANKPTF